MLFKAPDVVKSLGVIIDEKNISLSSVVLAIGSSSGSSST